MKYERVPVRHTTPQSRINLLKNKATQLLQKFCQQKVIEFGLSTKNFSYPFEFKMNSTTSKRSVFRLMSLLNSDLKKSRPYITSAEIPFFNPTVSSDSLTIDLGVLVNRLILPAGTRDRNYSDNNSLTDDQRAYPTRALNRYAKYLTFKARNAGIPLKLQFGITDSEVKKFKKQSDGSFVIVLAQKCVVTVALVHHTSDTSFVTFSRIRRNGWEGSEYAEVGAEPIFLIIPQIRKALRTLTRRVKYDSHAFIVGTGENSGLDDGAA